MIRPSAIKPDHSEKPGIGVGDTGIVEAAVGVGVGVVVGAAVGVGVGMDVGVGVSVGVGVGPVVMSLLPCPPDPGGAGGALTTT